jgi:hypothetical protein
VINTPLCVFRYKRRDDGLCYNITCKSHFFGGRISDYGYPDYLIPNPYGPTEYEKMLDLIDEYCKKMIAPYFTKELQNNLNSQNQQ